MHNLVDHPIFILLLLRTIHYHRPLQWRFPIIIFGKVRLRTRKIISSRTFVYFFFYYYFRYTFRFFPFCLPSFFLFWYIYLFFCVLPRTISFVINRTRSNINIVRRTSKRYAVSTNIIIVLSSDGRPWQIRMAATITANVPTLIISLIISTVAY